MSIGSWRKQHLANSGERYAKKNIWYASVDEHENYNENPTLDSGLLIPVPTVICHRKERKGTVKDVSRTGIFKPSAVDLNALCARPTCTHPLYRHLWHYTKDEGRWEVGVCKTGECTCIGYMVIATVGEVRV